MSRRSREKGKVGEREVAALLRGVFPNAERSYHQARSGAEASDVEGTPWWLEVELSARPSPHRKMRQALEASDGRPVAVVTRESSRYRSGEWLVTIRLEAFLELVARASEGGEQ